MASFELLEMLFSPKREKYYVIGLPGGPCGELTKNNYPPDKIIAPKVFCKKTLSKKSIFDLWKSEKKQIHQTNLNDLIRRYKIGAIAPDTYTSVFLDNWASKNKLKIISTPHQFQKKFENKIFFDKFLHKHQLPVPKSLILKSEKDLEKIDFFPVIVQIPESNGSSGTFLMREKKEILQLISGNKKVKLPLLCRHFIEQGIPLGVSVLIGPKKIVFSAIRMQAYFSQPDGKSIYYGIQWVKTSFFSEAIIKKINRMLFKAGKEFQKLGFRGIAAFDLILRGEELYFIECNPRTGGSTPHMAFRTELLHGLVFTEEFIKITTGGELSAHKPFIPDSKYEGFNLDCGFMAYYMPAGQRVNALKSGIYKFQEGKLQFISFKVEKFTEKKGSIFVYFVRPDGEVLKASNFIGFMLTHFPLLKMTKNKYTFSAKAQRFLKHVENVIIKK